LNSLKKTVVCVTKMNPQRLPLAGAALIAILSICVLADFTSASHEHEHDHPSPASRSAIAIKPPAFSMSSRNGGVGFA
jgi:hypothetical protein